MREEVQAVRRPVTGPESRKFKIMPFMEVTLFKCAPGSVVLRVPERPRQVGQLQVLQVGERPGTEPQAQAEEPQLVRLRKQQATVK